VLISFKYSFIPLRPSTRDISLCVYVCMHIAYYIYIYLFIYLYTYSSLIIRGGKKTRDEIETDDANDIKRYTCLDIDDIFTVESS